MQSQLVRTWMNISDVNPLAVQMSCIKIATVFGDTLRPRWALIAGWRNKNTLVLVIKLTHVQIDTSLVPRPLPAFQCCTSEAGGPGIRSFVTHVMTLYCYAVERSGWNLSYSRLSVHPGISFLPLWSLQCLYFDTYKALPYTSCERQCSERQSRWPFARPCSIFSLRPPFILMTQVTRLKSWEWPGDKARLIVFRKLRP